jgi:hypothetical protein
MQMKDAVIIFRGLGMTSAALGSVEWWRRRGIGGCWWFKINFPQ